MGGMYSFGVCIWPGDTSWKVRPPEPWGSILAAVHTSFSLRLGGPEAAGGWDGGGHYCSAIPQPGARQRPPEDEKEVIRRAIQKELKIKEGVENLRRVATDRRHLGHVQQLLRSSNRRLEQLHGELRALHARILLPGPGPGLAGE